MSSPTLTFVPADGNQAVTVSRLIYQSSHELFLYMLGNEETALGILTKLCHFPGGHFGYDFTTLAIENDAIVGAYVGYDAEQLAAEESRGSWQLMKSTPLKKWLRLAKDVGPTLANYIPPPSDGAYYINNITVHDDYRGKGYGRDLIQHAIDRAKSYGYRCVELDVTEDNHRAIGFYHHIGFQTVATHGTHQLTQECHLPRLKRMRLVLIEQPSLKPQHNPLKVNDVTSLCPIQVTSVYAPGSTEQLQWYIKNTAGPISIGGGRYSMGGQTASTFGAQIDMRGMNRIVAFDHEEQWIRVQGGTRWSDIQQYIDDYGLAIKIMQTYSNFTVGGSLSVNCHGRYVGLGPIILSVRQVSVMLADGELYIASPSQNSDLFYAVIGGYGAVGIIVEAELGLATNTRVERLSQKLKLWEYPHHFRDNVKSNENAVFHNADLYPPHYTIVNAVTWASTEKPATTSTRLNLRRRLYLVEKYLLWAITETPLGKWRREYLYDFFLFIKNKVHWRNYEAGYDVAELEPLLRDKSTYVLQEYFVPVAELESFSKAIKEILNRHQVNVVNISIRHAHKDPGSLLAWAREECFAFVLYYKQATTDAAKEQVGVWTRELIDAVLAHNGTYYLPYQLHATKQQFNQAYPNLDRFVEIKNQYDPEGRFTNALWDKYLSDQVEHAPQGEGLFHSIYASVESRDAFFLFLQNIYRLYPEAEFHQLIKEGVWRLSSDEGVYRYIQSKLPTIKPALSELTFALPSLKKQKAEMARQTAELLGEKNVVYGYLEIGTTGRYVNALDKRVSIQGAIYTCSDESKPDYSPAEIAERGQLNPIGRFFELNDYQPIDQEIIANESVDLVTCYIGLHHCAPEKLAAYLKSIHRILRWGGVFVVRDHDADTQQKRDFVSLVHTVFNAGLGISWEQDQQEPRYFNGISHWIEAIENAGFKDKGLRLTQAHDPSDNVLMAFVKVKEPQS